MADEQEDKFADIKKEIQTRFTLLPPDLQSVITSSEYQMKLFEIAQKHKITYEQLGALEMETTMVLLGMTPPAEFRDELQIQLKLNDPEIEALVKEVSDIVFVPIRESLMKVYDAKAQTEGRDEKTVIEGGGQIPQVTPSQAPEQKQPVSTPQTEAGILEKSGISLVDTAPSKDEGSLSRGDLMKGLENPPKTEPAVLNPVGAVPQAPISVPPPPSMLKDMPQAPKASDNTITGSKLGGIVSTPKTQSEYEIPKKPEGGTGATDPYREGV